VRLRTLLVPYDSGRRDARMGRGPDALVRHGAASALRAAGHDVDAESVEVDDVFPAEIATTFALYRQLAGRVRTATAEGRLPLVLSGNCGAAVGTVSGARRSADERVGVVWFDAHGDFNTPETSGSGFLDGMMLAALAGRCWRAMTASVPGFAPVRAADVALVGARDLDPAEGEALGRSGVTLVPWERLRERGAAEALEGTLAELARRVERVYIHVDVDVLDPARARGNALAPPGGLTPDELADAVRAVRVRCGVAAAGIASYDPAYDTDGSVYRAAVAALEAVAG